MDMVQIQPPGANRRTTSAAQPVHYRYFISTAAVALPLFHCRCSTGLGCWLCDTNTQAAIQQSSNLVRLASRCWICASSLQCCCNSIQELMLRALYPHFELRRSEMAN